MLSSITPPSSRRRDCHFTDTPFSSVLKHLLNGEGGAAEVSPTANNPTVQSGHERPDMVTLVALGTEHLPADRVSHGDDLLDLEVTVHHQPERCLPAVGPAAQPSRRRDCHFDDTPVYPY